ncbi:MAG: protein kinase [Myxococcaceae bacterium]|nr:protein kinase [Myxococcaceae bacterium]
MASSLDRFTVLQRLGAGGMAEVFKCRQRGLGGFEKVVVLKRILPHLVSEESFVTMFLDEARIAANLSHPNIVQTFEITSDANGVPYIVMEYVDGPSLAQLLKRAREVNALDLRHVARLLEGACRGLHSSHHANDAQGRPLHLIHRDISPQNILVTLDGVAKVADFGVARAEGRITHTQSGVVKGKLRFTAPEMLADPDNTRDPRTDVFSLGVCLYLACTGQTPFNGSTDLKVMDAIRAGHYPPPSSLAPGLPAELERIIVWLLEHDPERRCPSALAAAEALRAWLSQTAGSTEAELGPWVRSLASALTAPPPPPPDALGVLPSAQLVTKQLADEPADEIDIVVTGLTSTAGKSSRRWGLFAIVLMVSLTGVGVAVGLRQAAESRRLDAEREAWLGEAERELAEGHYARAEELLRRGAQLPERRRSDEVRLAKLEADLRLAREISAARAAIAAGEYDSAAALLRTLATLDVPDDRVAELTSELKKVEAARAARALAELADAGVAVDGGSAEQVAVLQQPATDKPRRPRPSPQTTTTAPTAGGEAQGTPTDVPVEPPPPLPVTPPQEDYQPPPVVQQLPKPSIQREPRPGSGASIRITASGPAQVYLDGLPVGQTPRELTKLGAATHLVMVWAEGYASMTERVAIGADEAVSMHFTLVPAP